MSIVVRKAEEENCVPIEFLYFLRNIKDERKNIFINNGNKENLSHLFDRIRNEYLECIQHLKAILFVRNDVKKDYYYLTRSKYDKIQRVNYLDDQNQNLEKTIKIMKNLIEFFKVGNNERKKKLQIQRKRLEFFQKQNNYLRYSVNTYRSTISNTAIKISELKHAIKVSLLQFKNKLIFMFESEERLRKRITILDSHYKFLKLHYDQLGICNSFKFTTFLNEDKLNTVYEPPFKKDDITMNEIIGEDEIKAYYEAVKITIKCSQESFISQIDKAKFELWHEKLTIKCRIDKEKKRNFRYECLNDDFHKINSKFTCRLFYLKKKIKNVKEIIYNMIENSCAIRDWLLQ